MINVRGKNITLAACFRTIGDVSSLPEDEDFNAIQYFLTSVCDVADKYIEYFCGLCKYCIKSFPTLT